MAQMQVERAPRLHPVELTVNGVRRSAAVEARILLVHFLRETLGLTGTHIGCDTTSCGACTVLVDGVPIKSCTMFAVQAAGCEITTVEGLAEGAALHPVQQAFHEEHGLQWPPMRLLHTGHDAHRGGPARPEPGPFRARDPLRALGADLPLHGLPEHREGGEAGCGAHEGAGMTGTRKRRPAVVEAGMGSSEVEGGTLP